MTTEGTATTSGTGHSQAVASRVAFAELAADVHRAMLGVDAAISRMSLNEQVVELVRIRASQMNGCAFCIDMHTKDARAAGETEQRIYALDAWRDTPFFSEAERAAVALTEAVTRLGDGGIPDAVYDEAARYFTPTALAALIAAIVMINAWNRVAITTRMIPGRYQSRRGVSS